MNFVLVFALLLVLFAMPAEAVKLPAGQPAEQVAPGGERSKDNPSPGKTDHPAAKVAINWLKTPSLQQSQVGLEIMDLPSGEIIYSYGGNRRFTPASTAKVFTTACALDTLGIDFQFHTLLQAYGSIKKDKLEGDLVIVPSQDPTFDMKDLYQLIAGLGERKIKYLDGRVDLAAVPGGFDQFYTGWLAEDWGQDWMPVSSNFVVDRNIAPGKDPGHGLPATEQSPQEPEPAILRSVLHSDLAPGWVSYDSASKRARVWRGTYPSMSVTGSLVVANPDDYNLAVATNIMKSSGIRFKNNPPSLRSSEQPQLIAEHVSKPLPEIMRECLKESDNLYAQQILRAIGQKTRSPGVGDHVTLEESGLAHLYEWLNGIGVRQNDVVLHDGCGLSRKNLVTPHALNMVLKHMAGEGLNGPYIGLLRLEGGGSSFFRYKTGAMDSVRTVAGILHTVGGNTMAVTVMVNGHLPQVGPVKSSIYTLTGQLEALPAYPAGKVVPMAAPAGLPATRPATRNAAKRTFAKHRRHHR